MTKGTSVTLPPPVQPPEGGAERPEPGSVLPPDHGESQYAAYATALRLPGAMKTTHPTKENH